MYVSLSVRLHMVVRGCLRKCRNVTICMKATWNNRFACILVTCHIKGTDSGANPMPSYVAWYNHPKK